MTKEEAKKAASLVRNRTAVDQRHVNKEALIVLADALEAEKRRVRELEAVVARSIPVCKDAILHASHSEQPGRPFWFGRCQKLISDSEAALAAKEPTDAN